MKKDSICNRVITFPQFTGTCWFNAILMTVLYSENSRKLLLHKSKTWDNQIQILDTLKYILKHKYMRTSNKYKDYKILKIFSPEYILHELYKHNKKEFIFNPKIEKEGYFSTQYIRKIYEFLGVSQVLYLDYNNIKDKLYYSIFNHITAILKFDIIDQDSLEEQLNFLENPEIIIINIPEHNWNNYPSYYHLTDDKYISLKSLQEKIIYNNEVYILDSVILSNYNKDTYREGGHAICGITCDGERYVYNGWSRDTNEVNITSKINSPVPCELMKFKWDIKQKYKNFCLNTKTCFPNVITNPSKLNIKEKKELCFSFGNGNRVATYINTRLKSNEVKECPEGKVLNPRTKKCINIQNLNKKLAVVKECPEGKVLNNITNRCNTIKKIVVVKECPDGKILNPITNRCNKIKKND